MMADIDWGRAETTKLIDEGVDLVGQGKLEEAIELFTRAIEADPNSSRAYLARADAYRRQANEDQASQDDVSANMLAAGGRLGPPPAPSPTAGPPVPRPEAPAKKQSSPDRVETTDAPEATPPAEEEPSSGRVETTYAPDAKPSTEHQVAAQMAIDDIRSRISPLPSDAGVTADQIALHPYGAWRLNRWGLRQGFLHWTVERLLRSMLLMAILAVAGSVLAKVFFCPEKVAGPFWTGCGVEMLAFTLGGAALGALISLSVTRGLRR